jgi:hypothetical protein
VKRWNWAYNKQWRWRCTHPFRPKANLNIHRPRQHDVHDRDSGVARHAAFLAVLQSFSKTGWDAKRNFYHKPTVVLRDIVGSAVAAADIDALGNCVTRLTSVRRYFALYTQPMH